MKLLSLNLGIKIDNTSKVVSFLREMEADIVCLQEVPDHSERTAKNMFQVKTALDRNLKSIYPYSYFSPLWQARGFTKLDFGGYIEQGNYILSKFPIIKSSTNFFHKKYEKVEDWHTVNFHTEDHGRALQSVDLDCDGKILKVFNLHGIWTSDKKGDHRTVRQAEFILDQVKAKEIPTILAGDFNLLPDSKSIEMIDRELRNLIAESEYKSTRPCFDDNLDKGDNIVDYIFVNKKVIVTNFEVLENEISDHLPLVLDFGLND